MRLPRPHVPFSVRVMVAFRQLCLITPHRVGVDQSKPAKHNLEALLHVLFGDEKVHLDHDPPLGAREKIIKKDEIVGYIPDANDPDFLFYRTATLHRLKTNVRGEHGQHPDRVLIKRQRRRERPAKMTRRTNWPKRKLQSASRWPKRKLGSNKSWNRNR